MHLSVLQLNRLWLDRCTLSGTDLRHATLDRCYFKFCDFSHANLCGASVRFARFAACDLQGADLWDSELTGAEFGPVNTGTFAPEAPPLPDISWFINSPQRRRWCPT
jgi:uncharacterized protein YjbI with pentapeptide repeats